MAIHPIITLTTDFGIGSPYVAQMKGVLLSMVPDAAIVDITNAIPPQDVTAGAIALREVQATFPAGTVHIAVVDPGVGTQRAILAMRCPRSFYVGPDNGVLTLVARQSPPLQVIRLTESRFWRQPVSATFHGRDIMAPVAAELASGRAIDELGESVSSFVELAWPAVVRESTCLHGEIVAIDTFGNAISNILRSDLPPGIPADQLTVSGWGRSVSGLRTTYGDARTGALIALIGSNDALELAIVGGNAAAEVGFGVGQPLLVSWGG